MNETCLSSLGGALTFHTASGGSRAFGACKPDAPGRILSLNRAPASTEKKDGFRFDDIQNHPRHPWMWQPASHIISCCRENKPVCGRRRQPHQDIVPPDCGRQRKPPSITGDWRVMRRGQNAEKQREAQQREPERMPPSDIVTRSSAGFMSKCSRAVKVVGRRWQTKFGALLVGTALNRIGCEHISTHRQETTCTT